jgi:flagellar basal-body rod protein FlgF
MIKGIGTSGTALIPMMTRLEVIANNLANANTAGFKRDNLFADMLSDAQLKEARSGGDMSGAMARQYSDFSEGSIQQTNNPLDMAIQGEGFFTVDTPRGVRYTRNGAFTVSREGLLTTKEGYPVLGTNGSITFPDPQSLAHASITVTAHGEISVDKKPLATLRIADFDNGLQLKKEGASLFILRSGTERRMDPSSNPATVRQGHLEESNVDSIAEMMEMIEITREFESDQKTIQAQDSTLDKAMEVGRIG